MNNQLQVFNHEQFGEVRTIYNEEENEVWFVARDLSKQLGYKSIERMYDHVDREDKKEINPQSQSYQGSCGNGVTLEPNPNIFRMVLINESGMYSAVFGSQLPQAKAFKRWVTSEVLPTIRRHGAYMTDQTIDELADNPDLLIKLATNLKEERDLRRQRELELGTAREEKKVLESTIEKQAPKVEMWEEFMNKGDNIDVGTVAKIFNIKELGRNNFYQLLRDKSIILKGRNTPRQQYVDSGYFEVKTITHKFANEITLVTPKGIEWLHGKLIQWGYIEQEAC